MVVAGYLSYRVIATSKGRTCMVSNLKYWLLIFHYMDMDDVIQDITLSIKNILDDDEEVTLCDGSRIAVEKHSKDIVEKVREAKKDISERIIPNNFSRSGMYLNPWRYLKSSIICK